MGYNSQSSPFKDLLKFSPTPQTVPLTGNHAFEARPEALTEYQRQTGYLNHTCLFLIGSGGWRVQGKLPHTCKSSPYCWRKQPFRCFMKYFVPYSHLSFFLTVVCPTVWLRTANEFHIILTDISRSPDLRVQGIVFPSSSDASFHPMPNLGWLIDTLPWLPLPLQTLKLFFTYYIQFSSWFYYLVRKKMLVLNSTVF